MSNLCDLCMSILDCTFQTKTKYLYLYRQLFKHKSIKLNYCQQCCENFCQEFQIELSSQTQHQSVQTQPQSVQTQPQITEINLSTNITPQLQYVILSSNQEKYQEIAKRFKETLSYTIIRIERNMNPILKRKFDQCSQQLSCQNIKYLFHGSSNQAYDNILNTGFDCQYASPSGLLGKGIYFAEDASYSHIYGRITNTNIGQINHLLYCPVNLGRTCQGHTGLIECPNGFDAVHSDHRTYAVFANYQGLPEYIIYYQV